ncbi:MAG: hypothetical protein V4582_02530 [Pseudomonadota bacterium]
MRSTGAVGTIARLLLLAACAMAAASAQAAKGSKGAKAPAYQFGVIGHSFKNGGDEAQLRRAIVDTGSDALAFVVATGIKGPEEPCSDTLYAARRALFDEAERPTIVAPAASDWSMCSNSEGRTIAVERLNRLRELFYTDASSLGAHKLALTRLSNSRKFRGYAENAYWESGKVLYATINLPANNNHFRPEAGRNSEFEDRLVANRAWLNRLLALAQGKRFEGMVLFSDGDALARPAPGPHKRDGYAETRHLIEALGQKFGGKLLLVDCAEAAHGGAPEIKWHANIGHLSVGSAVVALKVAPGAPALFTLAPPPADLPPAQEKSASLSRNALRSN